MIGELNADRAKVIPQPLYNPRTPASRHIVLPVSQKFGARTLLEVVEEATKPPELDAKTAAIGPEGFEIVDSAIMPFPTFTVCIRDLMVSAGKNAKL